MDSSIQKNRSEEVLLTRLRIGHTRLTHGYLMENSNPPICDTCQVRINVKHILIDCNKYNHHRQQNLGLHPRLESILGEKVDVRRLFKFLKDSNLIHLI